VFDNVTYPVSIERMVRMIDLASDSAQQLQITRMFRSITSWGRRDEILSAVPWEAV
jgi:hypothetical protein